MTGQYRAVTINGRSGREHVLVAMRALGRPLPAKAEVHHFNGDKSDNRPANLVVCQDRAYHSLLHRRQAALAATGNANFRRCVHCHTYDDPSNLIRHSARGRTHRACVLAAERRRRRQRRIARLAARAVAFLDPSEGGSVVAVMTRAVA